ncbi:MAG: alpha/beta fold hydrolase [Bacteroidales bacterium]
MNTSFTGIYVHKIFVSICLCVFVGKSTQSLAQNNDALTLSQIWETYDYYPAYTPEIKHVPHKNAFSFLYQNKIVHKSYTQQEHSVFLELPDSIHAQSFLYPPHSTSHLLIATQLKPIHRESYSAVFFEYDTTTHTFSKLFDTIRVQNPQYSPTSTENICFFYDNDLYLKKRNTVTPITTSGTENRIINGHPDWVYEEEFGLKSGYAWNTTGDAIVYMSFNESNVPQVSIPYYTEEKTKHTTFSYPAAGDSIPSVDLFVYNIHTQNKEKISIPQTYDYIPEFSWIDSARIAITLLDRLQQHISIVTYNINTQTTENIYSYTHSAYCDIPTYFTPINESFFIVTDDRTGQNNIHLYSYTKGYIRQLTSNCGVVTDVYGYNQSHQEIIYAATNNIPTDRYVFSVHLEGDITNICTKPGTHDIQFNSTLDYGIHTFSTANTAPQVSLINSRGIIQYEWFNNAHLTDFLNTCSQKEFFSIPHTTEDSLLAWKIMPPQITRNKKYPIIISLYGGPSSQTVLNKFSYNYLWHQYLAQQGYIVVSVDNRGVMGRNSHFRKQTYTQLGTLETEDIAHTINFLHTLPHADTSRIGIEGWSFGGYLSLLSAGKYPHAIDASVAIAPVTDWSFYDAIYTERYMQTPTLNKTGYTHSSVFNYTKSMQAPILLIHGTADDNVHARNSFLFLRILIEEQKDITPLFMPNDSHAIFEKNSRLYLYSHITKFYATNLHNQ